jgi:hypothetical protein
METTPADHSEEKTAAQKTKMKPEEQASTDSVDKFADARRAKKKEKRKRHRARLKRPHTSG